jgi:hypothetical protein
MRELFGLRTDKGETMNAKEKIDAVNDIVQRLGELPGESRLHVFAAVFSVLVEADGLDPIDTAGRCCAVHKMLKASGDLKQYQ